MSKFIPQKNVRQEQHMQAVRIANRAKALKALGDKLAEAHGLEKVDLAKPTEGKENE